MNLDDGEPIMHAWPQNIFIKSPLQSFGLVLFDSALGKKAKHFL